MRFRLVTVVAVAIAVMVLTLAGVAKAEDQQVHKHATALTWLTNSKHITRANHYAIDKAYARELHAFMNRLDSLGWLNSALCIHHFEGAWNDPNAPYYGGMQMDYEFLTTYGLVYFNRWGTSDRWPIWAQLHASFTAWTKRGWYPWPNTARYCSLL